MDNNIENNYDNTEKNWNEYSGIWEGFIKNCGFLSSLEKKHSVNKEEEEDPPLEMLEQQNNEIRTNDGCIYYKHKTTGIIYSYSTINFKWKSNCDLSKKCIELMFPSVKTKNNII